MRLKDVGEVNIIDSIRQRSRYLNDVVIPIGDDTAAVPGKRMATLLTAIYWWKEYTFCGNKLT